MFTPLLQTSSSSGALSSTRGANSPALQFEAAFGDALSEVDWMVGELVDHVENIGATPNTLVIFTSDNGPWLAKNQGGGSVGLFGATSAPYRNVGKGSTWEGGLRMPAFAYWPGKVPTSTKAHGAVSSSMCCRRWSLLRLGGTPIRWWWWWWWWHRP